MLRVFPLGGLGEIGMNCLALEQDGDVVLVDCGVTFDDRRLGVDVVHPDFRALAAWGKRVVGLVLTHGHEDHLGAVPYLLRRLDVPVWGPPYALGLLRHRAEEHEILRHARLVEIRPREVTEIGPFLVEPVRVTHSTADATALAITTNAGTILHTGDFKIDATPPDGEAFDEQRFRELGDAGVALMFSDSTNIDSPGSTGSEAGVGQVLDTLIGAAEGAVVVGLFASNVHRLRLLSELAVKYRRRLVPLGRSVGTHLRVAQSTGYLRLPSDLVASVDHARHLPRRAVLGIATGTQAESNAALGRISRGEHSALDLGKGDTVILSSRAIPGHEPEVYAMIAALLRRGIDVRSWATDRGVHVSGHAHRDEQRRMLELVRPRAFVPVHGTLHHMTRHAALAREVGVPETLVLENGDIAELSPASSVDISTGVAMLNSGPRMAKIGRIPVPRVYLHQTREVPRAVVRERGLLAEAGILVVGFELDATGRLHRATWTSQGLVEESASSELFAGAERAVARALDELANASSASIHEVEETVRLAARRAVHAALGTKPVTIAVMARRGS